jgi:hypothetical protein
MLNSITVSNLSPGIYMLNVISKTGENEVAGIVKNICSISLIDKN